MLVAAARPSPIACATDKKGRFGAMLHAIRHRKTNHHQRYRSRDPGYHGRVAAEDEITSTIFGPLAMFPAADSIAFWRELLRAKRSDFFPHGEPVSARYKFWARFQSTKADRTSVEPDLLVEYEWHDKQRRNLLVEIKWNAGLSGESQLENQWIACLDVAERSSSLHFFIAHTIGEAVAADPAKASSASPWRDGPEAVSRLLPMVWPDVRTALRGFADRKHALSLWASLTADMLGSLGVSDFVGFDTVLARLRKAPKGLRLASRGARWEGFDQVLERLPQVMPRCRPVRETRGCIEIEPHH
jgi:hypothetical protein